MKHLKMLTLAVAAAATLTALAGAGTASATALCFNNISTNSCTQTYPAGTEFKATNAGTVKITTEYEKNVECTGSGITWKVEKVGGEHTPVSGKVQAFTLTGCNCEVNVLKVGSLETNWIETTDNGDLFSSGLEITSTCSTLLGNVHCIYSTSNTPLGELKGGQPAKFIISSAKITPLATNSLCQKKALLDATYEIPGPLYVAAQ